MRAECLHRVVVLGARYLERLLATYVKNYNEKRSHQGLGLNPPGGSQPFGVLSSEPTEINRRDLLGGIITSTT